MVQQIIKPKGLFSFPHQKYRSSEALKWYWEDYLFADYPPSAETEDLLILKENFIRFPGGDKGLDYDDEDQITIRPFNPATDKILPEHLRLAVEVDSEYCSIYEPLEEHDLHRTFANTPCTLRGIRTFARGYGNITPPAESIRRRYLEKNLVPFARMDSWLYEIGELNELMTLWDTSRGVDQKPIAELLGWPRAKIDENTLRIDLDFSWNTETHSGEIYPNSELSGPIYWHFAHLVFLETVQSTRDPRKIAELIVNAGIDSRLKECKPSINFQKKWGLQLIPKDLMGAIYVHFAMETIGGWKPTICPYCGELFHKGRKNQVYCSENCRYARYHKDKNDRERAKEFYTQGLRIEEIAAKLGQEKIKIETWIKGESHDQEEG